MAATNDREWLEADGLGGFASGTVTGTRSRRYHALLLAALTPPTGRHVLVNGLEAWVETPAGIFSLSSQRYSPDILHPDGASRIESFESDPWPQWVFKLEDGTRVRHELFVPHGSACVALAWRLLDRSKGVTLAVRLLLSGRDHHTLHHENSRFRFEPEVHNGRVIWRPYPGIPGVAAYTNGPYTHQPDWYRNFLYTQEQERGLDCTEDLAAPGIFRWDLSGSEAFVLLCTEGHEDAIFHPGATPEACFRGLRLDEQRRRQRFSSRLERAADAYIVRRGQGKTIIAGYPWFTDWGRDTFISLRGLCLATGRIDDARRILLEWAGCVRDGMLPNRFPDQGEQPEFNAVDASLWFIIAVAEYLDLLRQEEIDTNERQVLIDAVEAILIGYSRGTRFGIALEDDGLLRAGEPGVQLTWMDALVHGEVVTPRIGKPVEVQALWLNALHIGGRWSRRWAETFDRGQETFRARFWNEARRCLLDVIDVDHRPGTVDAAFRPNQIFAVGGLPLNLLDVSQARAVVEAVEARLWTPLGLRSLASDESSYQGQYTGDVHQRDHAYHQGTVWPWLLGPFVEAWVRVHGDRAGARQRFLTPLLAHLDTAGIGHLPEIADGDPPHLPRGCPFQAWSVAEALRLDRVVLAERERET